MVTQKVALWGNSLGVRLPQSIVQTMGLKAGATVSIAVEDNKIVLSPTGPKYTLQELLEGVTPESQHDELDWGNPIGEEIW